MTKHVTSGPLDADTDCTKIIEMGGMQGEGQEK